MKKLITGLSLLGILEIGLSLYLTFWREHFWQSISLKNQSSFIIDIAEFTGIALFLCVISGLISYISNVCAIKWRERLTERALKADKNAENYAQRLQEDTIKYPTLSLNLIFGFGKALLYIIVFSIALIWSFHWLYLTVLVIYSIIGTFLARKIANPLISLNYESQRQEATYRQILTTINFNKCIVILFGLAKRQKKLTYFQSFFAQVGVVLPILLIAPEYFSTAMTIGLLMRFSSTAGSILDNLSYGVNSFASINEYLASRKRLKEIGVL